MWLDVQPADVTVRVTLKGGAGPCAPRSEDTATMRPYSDL